MPITSPNESFLLAQGPLRGRGTDHTHQEEAFRNRLDVISKRHVGVPRTRGNHKTVHLVSNYPLPLWRTSEYLPLDRELFPDQSRLHEPSPRGPTQKTGRIWSLGDVGFSQARFHFDKINEQQEESGKRHDP